MILAGQIWRVRCDKCHTPNQHLYLTKYQAEQAEPGEWICEECDGNVL